MAALSPFKFPFPRGLPRFGSVKKTFSDSLKQPPIGLTQGGSSRKAKGAKAAATDGLFREKSKTQTGE